MSEFQRQRAARRGYNLLLGELQDTIMRARVGGFFYPLATGLACFFTTSAWSPTATAIVVAFALLAVVRTTVRIPPEPDLAGIRGRLVAMWSIILVTSFAWAAFSVWCFRTLPEPGSLIALLFTGAFGMAMCHTLCMRRLPAAVAIGVFMLPPAALLWMRDGTGVALMWLIYMGYMLIVLVREHRAYRRRLELEEDLRQQRDVLEKQTRVDALTGISNRRAFDESLERAIGIARDGARVALLILDLDHFKQVNDTHGHLAGDACLVLFAQRLRADFGQAGDLPARLGGEEFGVILAAGVDEAAARAEQFRRALESAPIVVEDKRIPVTVSIGYGSFDPAAHAGADALYDEVDAALYRAKLGGRNRVEASRPGRAQVREGEPRA
ncbi:MAG: GGDEF domain-containing protein [Xanthomonadales bacterium]|nr:GGDEF domain-containing protein [Xanthomonadales bacterium]